MHILTSLQSTATKHYHRLERDGAVEGGGKGRRKRRRKSGKEGALISLATRFPDTAEGKSERIQVGVHGREKTAERERGCEPKVRQVPIVGVGVGGGWWT